jgi:uncharacterized protein YidB (DUF937 family)
MGLLDGVLGGVVGAVVSDVIRKHGGVQGVVSQFETQGFGPTVRSWVGTGSNMPIAAEHVQQVLGPDLLQQLSAKTGMPVAELAQKLAQILPQTIDQMTPDGVIPKA